MSALLYMSKHLKSIK